MHRVAIAVIAALVAGLGGWGATTLGGAYAVDAVDAVTVGSESVARDAIEAEAVRLAGHRARRLPAARRVAADSAIERLWLEGEAAARKLRRPAGLKPLRGEVADALAGPRPQRGAGRFARAFDAFHERWRSRTRCEPAYHDPYEDRCGNLAAAVAGTCRWMGEATLCGLGGDGRARWLVLQDAASARASRRGVTGAPATLLRRARTDAGSVVVRLRSRARAVALVRAVYVAARAVRGRESRRAASARAEVAGRAAAAREEARARELAARMRDPRLPGRALASARAACARQVADSDPYMFGFGMQDVVGSAEGLITARAALATRLAGSARDAFDRRKLRPLVRAVAAGNRELARMAAAELAGDHAAAAGVVARLDARTEPERAIARRLGLGDCLARPAR